MSVGVSDKWVVYLESLTVFVSGWEKVPYVGLPVKSVLMFIAVIGINVKYILHLYSQKFPKN